MHPVELAYEPLQPLLPDPHQTWIWENGGDKRGYDVAHLTANAFYVRKGLSHKKAIAAVEALKAGSRPEVVFEHSVAGILLLNITELRWSQDANRVEIHRVDGSAVTLSARDKNTHWQACQALWHRLAPLSEPKEI